MALTVKAQEDVTSLLTNPDFESDASGWTIVGGNKIAATAADYGYNGTKFIENWVAAPETLGDQSWSQTIEVPNGVYVIKSLAHAILQSDASVVPAGVAIYANKDEVAVTTTNTNPPTEYSVATVVTDGKLTIGYRITSCNINWAAWDNVRVFQYLGATEEEAKLAWMRDELETLGTTAMELIENPMSQELAAAITATVNAIADVATYEAAAALLETLKAQVADAKLCIAAYEDYLAVVAAAEKELERGFTEGVDEFTAAIAAAKAAHDNGTLSLEEVEAAIVKLNDDIFTFQMLNADGTERFDVTGRFMTNPTLRKGNQGWSGDAPGLEHEVMEFYNCDFDMYQELTGLPNGMYVVQVQALYRVGGNDGGVAYEEGTENISAQLYANNKSVPLISIYQHRASDMGVTSGEVLNDYVNMRVAVNEAFNLINPETEMGYYAENELTVVVQDGTLKLGLRNSGHQSTSWCAFREFKLYYYGNFPAVVLTVSMENAEAWLDENDDVLPGTAYDELSDAISIADEYTEIGAYEEAEVMAAMNELEAVLSSVQNVLVLMNQLREMTTNIEDNLFALNYPGLDALAMAYEAVADLTEDGADIELPEGYTTEEYYKEAVATLQAAIDAYYESQEATKENPADYTHLLPNPNFEQKGDWTWSVVGGGTDQWNGGCRPNEDGGANRQGVNLWGWGITSIDVHQELTNLPNGLYKVSAELITQTNFATDQHVYAVGVAKTTSKALEIEGWDSYQWEELTTTDYAVVLDGKLTIGAASSQGGTDSQGWFQATNFKLHYYGEATDEDLKAAWEASLARANEYTTILLPGDSKEVAAAIAAASVLAAEGKYSDACQALNPVVAASDSIYNVTLKFREGNYQALLDLIEGVEAGAASLQVIEAAIDFAEAALKAEDATHEILEPTNAKLGGYVAYVTYLIEVENTIPTLKGLKAEYRNYMNETVIATQVADLVAKFRSAASCEALLAKLKKAMGALEGSLYGNLTAGDLTLDLIKNPAIDDAAATGWTLVKGNAQNAGTNKGEHYDSRTPDNIYLDAWNPNVGVNNVTFYQEIFGLPDGTYQLTVATRTDGDNAYVFAAPEPLEEDTAKWTAATQWDMVNNYGAFGGEIFAADTLKMLADQAAGVVNEYPYYLARDGQGYGWSYDTINVVVSRRYLAIGITANQLLTGQAQYNGTWLGADDWKLVLVEKAAVQSEFNPFSGIENVEAVAPVKMGTYDLFGRRIDAATAPGIYIVNGKKVLIKK